VSPEESVNVRQSSPADRSEGDARNVESHLARLAEIVSEMQSGRLGLDETLALFEEGIEHVRITEQVLTRAERKVEEIIEGGRTRPFAEERTGDRGPSSK